MARWRFPHGELALVDGGRVRLPSATLDGLAILHSLQWVNGLMGMVSKAWLARRSVLVSWAALFTATLAILPPPASALVWKWSFSRLDTPIIDAFGELTTTDTPNGQGFYTITGVTGKRNMVDINGFLPVGDHVPGNCVTASNCYVSDNLLRPKNNNGQLTTHGFGVSFADGTYANYFFANFLPTPGYLEFYSVPPFGVLPPDTSAGDSELPGQFEASKVDPVPGPLPISGALMGLGWARQLRRRLRNAGP